CDLLPLPVSDALATGDSAAPGLRVDRLDIGKESFGRERHFGEVDQMRRTPVLRRRAVTWLPAGERRGAGEKAGVAPHDDIDLDAAEARVVERVAHQRERHVARGGREPGRVVVLEKIVVDGLRHVEAAELVAGRGRLLAHDAAGVGRGVAADVEEIADIIPAAAVEDLLAISLVWLV